MNLTVLLNRVVENWSIIKLWLDWKKNVCWMVSIIILDVRRGGGVVSRPQLLCIMCRSVWVLCTCEYKNLHAPIKACLLLHQNIHWLLTLFYHFSQIHFLINKYRNKNHIKTVRCNFLFCIGLLIFEYFRRIRYIELNWNGFSSIHSSDFNIYLFSVDIFNVDIYL